MSEKIILLGDYTVSLLRCVIHDIKPQQKPAELSWEEIYAFSKKHHISNMVYYAVKEMGLTGEQIAPFEEDYKKYTLREARQEVMTEQLLACFEEQKIKCMPMKGYIIKRYYPIESMRYSVDVDIYFDEQKSREMNDVMLDNGFSFYADEYDQYIYRKKPIYNYEMHKFIIETDTVGNEYFTDLWDRSILRDGKNFIYEMNNDDLYIYIIRHFHKHYVGEGAGLRFLLDIYFLKNKLKNPNRDYIEKVLDNFKLLKFTRLMEELSELWFGKERRTYDTSSIKIAEFIYNNGAFGDGSSGSVTRAESTKQGEKSFVQKVKSYLKWWFLGLDDMKKSYHILNKAPILLPFCWLHKGIKTLLFKPQAIKRESDKLKYAKKVKEIFKLSGLE